MRAVRRVLMTADTIGGVWRYAIDLAAALDARGVEVVLATMGAPLGDDQWAEAGRVPGLTIEESVFKLEWMPDSDVDLRAAGEWLLGLEARHRPDVVHLNGYAHGTLRWRAPVVVAGHPCVPSWWRAVKGEDAPTEWDAYAARARNGLMAADAVIAPSRSYLETLRAHYGPLPHGRVILNGRDPRGLAPVAEKAPVVFAAGRVWDEAKNLSLLGDVAERLDWPVVVAGDATGPDGARRPLAGVEALGRLSASAVRRHMATAAIFASPARYEPFGLAVLEAAMAGCALVLSDIPTFRELWSGRALFRDPDDPAAWADAIESLRADTATRRRLAEAAREHAATFTAERMGEETLALYHALAAAPARAPA